jgi:hypothetical protein
MITRRAFSGGLTLALLSPAPAGSAQQVGPIYHIGILSSTDPTRPNENLVAFRERRACQRVVIATTEKLLRTKLKAHRRTCRLVGRSTVSIRHL